MPFVPVPKDLTKVKTKVAFNLTKRQLVCFGLGGLIGIPAYIFTRGSLGNETSALLMIGLMMPFFFSESTKRTASRWKRSSNTMQRPSSGVPAQGPIRRRTCMPP